MRPGAEKRPSGGTVIRDVVTLTNIELRDLRTLLSRQQLYRVNLGREKGAAFVEWCGQHLRRELERTPLPHGRVDTCPLCVAAAGALIEKIAERALGESPAPLEQLAGDRCESCHGSGQVLPAFDEVREGPLSEECPVCRGTGRRG